MKFQFVFVFLACLLLFTGCIDDEEPIYIDCVDAFVADSGMVPYEGQNFGCNFFLELFEYNNEQYFVMSNPCIDMLVFPTKCDGERLCEIDGDVDECQGFWEEAVFIEIVGVDF